MIVFVAALGHGSLRDRNNPPQHLVRRKRRRCNVQNELASNNAAQGAPSQPPAPSPSGQLSHLLSRSMDFRNKGVKRGLPAPANGIVVPNGVVTLLKEEHENSTPRTLSSYGNRLAPDIHRRPPKGAVRSC